MRTQVCQGLNNFQQSCGFIFGRLGGIHTKSRRDIIVRTFGGDREGVVNNRQEMYTERRVWAAKVVFLSACADHCRQ